MSSLTGNYGRLLAWSSNIIKQKVDLMNMIVLKDTNDYTKKHEQFYHSSIGSHIRHSCDHYDKLLTLYDTRVISYDKRIRDSVIENDINTAIKHCDKLIITLNNISINKNPHPNHPVIIEFMSDNNDNTNIQLGSDFMRELAFVTHHSVHHISSVKLMMDSIGYIFKDSKYGLANSTIRYKNE